MRIFAATLRNKFRKQMIYNRYELCEAVSIPTNHLSVLLKRGNIIEVNGQIDTANPVNKKQIEKLLATKAQRDVKGAIDKKAKIIVREKKTEAPNPVPIEKPFKPSPPVSDEAFTGATDLYLKQQLIDLKKKEVDTRIAELKEQKLKGQTIPIDVMEEAVSHLGKQLLTAYHLATGQILDEYSHRHRLTPEMRSEMEDRLMTILNYNHKQAIESATKTIQDAADLYSEKRGKGERD